MRFDVNDVALLEGSRHVVQAVEIRATLVGLEGSRYVVLAVGMGAMWGAALTWSSRSRRQIGHAWQLGASFVLFCRARCTGDATSLWPSRVFKVFALPLYATHPQCNYVICASGLIAIDKC